MYELREYQRTAVDLAWADLCAQAGNSVIVLPTGAGKSLLVAELARRARELSRRVIVLAHRKELLEQNAEKVRALLPGESVGLFSAGLKQRSTSADIVLAGIQSAHKGAALFGARHLVLIDEVHLVGDEGMYRTFIDELRGINPGLRMVGLTATPYRTGEGKIVGPDKLFQRIAHEVAVAPLIAAGFLSPLVSATASAAVDCTGLKVRGGEFIQGDMERLFDDQAKVTAACVEIANKTKERNSVLIFCAGVGHAQHTAETLEEVTGESVGVVTGNTMPIERSATLANFRGGSLRFLVNCDVLTTGFDAPNIDAISILRATHSPGLFVQICGRGFRTSPRKKDCLVLDFGGNITRHGPVDAVDFNSRRRAFGGGEAPAKTCPNCEEACPASVLFCEGCGFKFPPRQLSHDEIASSAAILSAPESFTVTEVRLSRHKKRKAEEGSPDTLRVDYLCRGIGNVETTISEWVCLEHTGFAYRKASLWWQVRSRAPLPDIDEAVSLWQRGAIAEPILLRAQREGKFWRILTVDLEPVPETWREEEEEPASLDEQFGDELPF